MKLCQTCDDEFADKFSFCPMDGTPLSEVMTPEREPEPFIEPLISAQSVSTFPLEAYDAYHLTIIEDAGLMRRLWTELQEAARESHLNWPEFKRDPFGFARRSATAYGLMAWRFFAGPNVAIATLTSILVMMTAVIGLVWLDRHRSQSRASADRQRDDVDYIGLLTDIPADQTDKEGAPGLNKGTGGGSKPEQERPGGGGGGGRDEQIAASQGKVPLATLTPPVLAPDPKAPEIKNPTLPMAATIQADPLLFPQDNRTLPYGVQKSDSGQLSSGPGTGGGIGDGSGTGVGPGDGRGYGRGSDFNTGGGPGKVGSGGTGGPDGGTDYRKIFRSHEVTQKARILSKPSPEYTEEARKNQVTGTVVLQMVFSSSGSVTNIRTVSGLPFGLTEKAINAARRIQFTPATKDGRAVSTYMRVEYNFNIY